MIVIMFKKFKKFNNQVLNMKLKENLNNNLTMWRSNKFPENIKNKAQITNPKKLVMLMEEIKIMVIMMQV